MTGARLGRSPSALAPLSIRAFRGIWIANLLSNIGGWMHANLGTNFEVPPYEAGIFGVILIVVMLFRPEGLLPSARVKAELHEGVHDQPLYDVAHE